MTVLFHKGSHIPCQFRDLTLNIFLGVYSSVFGGQCSLAFVLCQLLTALGFLSKSRQTSDERSTLKVLCDQGAPLGVVGSSRRTGRF